MVDLFKRLIEAFKLEIAYTYEKYLSYMYDIINNNSNLLFISTISIIVVLYLYALIIIGYLNQIVKILQLKKPGLVFISFTQGEDGMLKFVLVLPEKGVADVVARELKFSIADNLFDVELNGDVVESPEFSGNDNDQVIGTLVDIDDAGNRSEAREFSFVLVDSIAPPQPGELGLKLTGEE